MPNARIANAVRLEFAPDSLVQTNLSGAGLSGDGLWVAGDEVCGLRRLRRLSPVGHEVSRLDEFRDFKWLAARPSLSANREPVRVEAALNKSVSLPHGLGTHRAESVRDWPPAMSGRKARGLVPCGAPGADRKEREHTIFGDLVRHD